MLPMKNWTLMLPIRIGLFDVTNKNWVLNVANEKLGFGGMRYVQWAHKANFGFCQALKEKKKKRAKYVVFGLYGNGLYRDPIW